MKKSLINWVLSAALVCTAHAKASDCTLDDTIFDVIGSTYNIDPLLLYSIALTESATGAGGGKIAPHAYVYRTDSGAVYFDDLEKAEASLKKVLAETSNVDVGLMQINMHWHPQPDPTALLDPVANLSVAAAHLKTTLASTPDPIIGVGRYHSWRDELAVWYGQKVWQTYRNIQSLFN